MAVFAFIFVIYDCVGVSYLKIVKCWGIFEFEGFIGNVFGKMFRK